MEYRECGKNHNVVSVIGLGSVPLKKCDRKQTEEIILYADQQGINLLDMYVPVAEVRDYVGAALRQTENRWYIQGHLCTIEKNGEYARTYQIEEVRQSFEDLLERMHIDFIDFGIIHYIDTEEEYNAVTENGIYDYAYSLLKNGVIGQLGFSSHNPYIAVKMLETEHIDYCMFSINPAYDMEKTKDVSIYEMMERKKMDAKVSSINPDRFAFYNYCERNNVSVAAMKVFGGGTLLNRDISPFGREMSVHQCVKYALDRPSVASAIVGVEDTDELNMILQYFSTPDEEKDYSQIYRYDNLETAGRCMYCGHCHPCSAAIDIATVNKYLDLALAGDKVPGTVREHYSSLRHHASECTRCGKCEQNCPFSVQIRKRMKSAAETFGY